ncbi:MAG: hypothetical protein NT007_18665 [Candidatus Kapabacteria bacterium]|nr:hypothetical protein [Candidatus Kapabacteria bacterium]
MTKFLIILLLILGGIIFGITYILKFIQNVFSSITGTQSVNGKKNRSKTDNGEVIYNKDEIVVLKGEAGKKKAD